MFCQQASRFSIPNNLLALKVNLEKADTEIDVGQFDLDLDFVSAVKQLINVYISNKNCTIDEIAKAIDVPRHTLQRALKTHGTSFSELLAQEKFVLAKGKLMNSSLKIAAISHQLGYSDPAHFTHAFQRWSGMSPSEFRLKLNRCCFNHYCLACIRYAVARIRRSHLSISHHDTDRPG